MVFLILGILLWVGPHLFKRAAPGISARMDPKQRKLGVTVASFVAIVLMVIGYRGWDAGVLYVTPGWTLHAMMGLMIVAIYLQAVAGMKTRVARVIRHPQLTGVVLWSLAHLMVNGDWASLVLFGSLLVWAVASMMLENAQQTWTKPAPAPMGKEIGALVGTLIVVFVAIYIHKWLGHPIF